jgi:hypothetical protein
MDPDLVAYVNVLIDNVNKTFAKDANERKKRYTTDMANTRAKNIPIRNKKLMFFNITKAYNSNIRALMLRRRNDVQYIIANTKTVPGKNYRKFALIVGINYTGDPTRELKGSVPDAIRMEDILFQNGYSTVLITDRPGDIQPTLNNITQKLIELLQNKVNGDTLFFYFSGHATFINDSNIHGDEMDGKDELFTTVDYNAGTGQPNYLTDDILKTLIQNNLPTGVRMICVMDACNSGTLLDLKYNYYDTMNGGQTTNNPASVETNGQVVLLSSSQDNQLSGEALINYDDPKSYYGGIFTFAFRKVIQEKKNELLTYRDLLFAIRQKTDELGFTTQTAQLSSGKLMNPTSTYFSL